MLHTKFLGPSRILAKMTGKQVKLFCELDAEADVLLHQAMMELGLSARRFNKLLMCRSVSATNLNLKPFS